MHAYVLLRVLSVQAMVAAARGRQHQERHWVHSGQELGGVKVQRAVEAQGEAVVAQVGERLQRVRPRRMAEEEGVQEVEVQREPRAPTQQQQHQEKQEE